MITTMSLSWKHGLPLKDIWTWWETAKCESNVQELGRRVAKRLREQPWFERYDELMALPDEFDSVENIEEFDGVLDELYDWADVGKRCWVETS